VKGWFGERLEAAKELGVSEDQIALDPGLDFDLSVADGLEILRRLAELKELGRPLYLSLSRKDFLGAALAGSWDERAAASDREWATAAAATVAVTAGADVLRLHDPSALQAMRIATAIDQPDRSAFSSSAAKTAPRVRSGHG
jgi:dihydropteroate synthase